MKITSKIYVAGHTGLVGSALMRKLEQKGFSHIITYSSQDLDLRNQAAVEHFFKHEQPEYVFLAAAKVGGIKANMDAPAQFIYDNVTIAAHVIHTSYKYHVKKLLFLGSSAIYPSNCPQPIKEEYLLAGPIEHSHEPYSIAKIAGIKMCQSYNKQYGTHFISCIATNLYGPHDNFDTDNGHVVPALIRNIWHAHATALPAVTVWGSGNAYRELLYIDDLADACYLLMHNDHTHEIVNVGSSNDITIAELAHMIKKEIGYTGKLLFDAKKPEGALRRLLDSQQMRKLGWSPTHSLHEGIKETIQWFIEKNSDTKWSSPPKNRIIIKDPLA